MITFFNKSSLSQQKNKPFLFKTICWVLPLVFLHSTIASAQTPLDSDNQTTLNISNISNNQTNNSNNQITNIKSTYLDSNLDSSNNANPQINPSNQLLLPLKEATTMLLNNNPEIQLQKENVSLAQLEVKASKGIYDKKLSAFFQYNLDSFPITSTLIRSTKSFTNVTSSIYTYNASFSKSYPAGGSIRLQFDNTRLETDEAFATLLLQYRSRISFTFSQPLLRNFRINDNVRKSRILEKKINISEQLLRQRIIDLIAQTEKAYHELAFAIKNVELIHQTVLEAEQQLALSKLRVNAGTLAPIEVVSANTELALRKEKEIIANLAIKKAETALKKLILGDPESPIWQQQIIPTDPIDFNPNLVDLNTAISDALARRSEVRILEIEREINKIDSDYFSNQRKPQLDVFSTFFTQNLNGQRNQNPNAPDSFVGNYFETLLGIYKFRGYVFGATFSFNFNNRDAKANLAKTFVTSNQVETSKQKVFQTITIETSNSLRATELSLQRVLAAQLAVTEAEIQLHAEQSRYQQGVSTNFLVFKSQNRLALAQARELRAKIDYINAQTELKKVTASNID